MDMPDTVTATEASASGSLDGDYDDAAGYYTPGTPIADTKAPDAPIAERWQTRKFEARAGQPGQPPQALDHHRRHRPGRRLRRRHARRGRLPGEVLLLPGLPAPRALDRRAGRHQRREELQGGRRLGPPALLRHRQGRRLPLARVQRLPPRRGQRQHHRPVRRPGRPVRPRVRRPARQPLLRRRAGLAHLLRPRPDRPAAADRRLPGARAPGRRRHRDDVHPPRDARADHRRRTTAAAAASSPATWSPARSRPTSPTSSCSPRAATATSSTSRPTRWAATSPPRGARTARAPTWPTPASRRSTRPASRSRASTSPS